MQYDRKSTGKSTLGKQCLSWDQSFMGVLGGSWAVMNPHLNERLWRQHVSYLIPIHLMFFMINWFCLVSTTFYYRIHFYGQKPFIISESGIFSWLETFCNYVLNITCWLVMNPHPNEKLWRQHFSYLIPIHFMFYYYLITVCLVSTKFYCHTYYIRVWSFL